MSSDIEVVEIEVPGPVAALSAQVEQIREGIEELAEAGDWEALVRGVVPLAAIMKQLRELEAFAKQRTAETMPEKRLTVEGVGTVERRAATQRRKWDSEELLRKILVQALVDTETGEIKADTPMEAADVVMHEVLECLPVTPSVGWRVTALKARGFDADEWCETTYGAPTIQITTSNREGK